MAVSSQRSQRRRHSLEFLSLLSYLK